MDSINNHNRLKVRNLNLMYKAISCNVFQPSEEFEQLNESTLGNIILIFPYAFDINLV